MEFRDRRRYGRAHLRTLRSRGPLRQTRFPADGDQIWVVDKGRDW